MEIEQLTERHWPQVSTIYESGIATGNATFAQSVPDWSGWDDAHVKSCRLVATDGESVVGWVALTSIKDQCTFAGVAEISVYVAETARGKGVGRQLLNAAISESDQNNFWTLEARIFPENTASLKIHQDAGFRIVGRRERIAQLNGVWRDIVLLERRSNNVGL